MKQLLIKILNSKTLLYIIELILPTTLTYLIYRYIYILVGYDELFELFIVFIILLYLILIAEWQRRYKNKKNEPTYIKYFYILIMFIVFGISISFIEKYNSGIEYRIMEYQQEELIKDKKSEKKRKRKNNYGYGYYGY